jgi:hypothetical protein
VATVIKPRREFSGAGLTQITVLQLTVAKQSDLTAADVANLLFK